MESTKESRCAQPVDLSQIALSNNCHAMTYEVGRLQTVHVTPYFPKTSRTGKHDAGRVGCLKRGHVEKGKRRTASAIPRGSDLLKLQGWAYINGARRTASPVSRGRPAPWYRSSARQTRRRYPAAPAATYRSAQQARHMSADGNVLPASAAATSPHARCKSSTEAETSRKGAAE